MQVDTAGVLNSGSFMSRQRNTISEALRSDTGGSSGKLHAAGMPLGAPLRTGGWRIPDVTGTGAKLLRKVSKVARSKPELGGP